MAQERNHTPRSAPYLAQTRRVYNRAAMTRNPQSGTARPAPPSPPSEESSAASPLELLRFALRSARKHVALSLLVFLGTALLGVAAVAGIPSVYDCTAKIYATQAELITVTLASGRRSDEASVARGLNEAVFRRSNLLSIVREARLVEGWNSTRTWPLRLKDKVSDLLFGPPSVADKERALVELLTRAIQVAPEDSASIRFRVQWRDRQAALKLTQLVQRNFLATRSAEEVAAITRAIALLEAEQARTDALIDPAITEVQRHVAAVREADTRREAESKAVRAPGRPRAVVRPAASAGAAGPASAPAVLPDALATSLQELRQAQRAILEPWQRRNADLKFQLTELRATLGPEHPTVRAQEAKVQAASEEPTELAALRQREADLLASFSQVGTTEPARTVVRGGAGAPSATSLAALPLRSLTETREDPAVATARARLETILAKSREISERLDAARIELATTTAGFKYRYAVIEAPELPRKPLKPKRSLFYGGALAFALLLGLLTGAARELATRRLVDSWQVRGLGLDVLAEVDLPTTPPK